MFNSMEQIVKDYLSRCCGQVLKCHNEYSCTACLCGHYSEFNRTMLKEEYNHQAGKCCIWCQFSNINKDHCFKAGFTICDYIDFANKKVIKVYTPCAKFKRIGENYGKIIR